MNHIKNNNLIGIAVIIVALTVGYYFGVFLPKEKIAQSLAINQSKCLQLEKDVVGGWKKDSPEDFISGSNHYNTKLNKCIVEVFSRGTSSTLVSILDAVEDANLASCITTDNDLKNKQPPYCYTGDNNDITKSQFDKLEKQYLSQ